MVQALDLCNSRLPKPVDITKRLLQKNYSQVPLKLHGTRSFLVWYKRCIYPASSKVLQKIVVQKRIMVVDV